VGEQGEPASDRRRIRTTGAGLRVALSSVGGVVSWIVISCIRGQEVCQSIKHNMPASPGVLASDMCRPLQLTNSMVLSAACLLPTGTAHKPCALLQAGTNGISTVGTTLLGRHRAGPPSEAYLHKLGLVLHSVHGRPARPHSSITTPLAFLILSSVKVTATGPSQASAAVRLAATGTAAPHSSAPGQQAALRAEKQCQRTSQSFKPGLVHL
jgi:hypothetical protein